MQPRSGKIWVMRRLSGAVIFLTLSSHVIAADTSEGMARFIEENIGLKNDDSLSLAQLRAQVHPNKETAYQLRNLYVPGQVDRIVTLRNGRGLDVQAYVTAPGRALIQRVTLTTPQFKLPLGLQINRSSLDDVYKAFGTRGKSEKGPSGALAERFYDPNPDGYEVSALLWFDRNQRLVGVEWHYQID
jgi:hypothetical protein